jgi:hypothetical protein
MLSNNLGLVTSVLPSAYADRAHVFKYYLWFAALGMEWMVQALNSFVGLCPVWLQRGKK